MCIIGKYSQYWNILSKRNDLLLFPTPPSLMTTLKHFGVNPPKLFSIDRLIEIGSILFFNENWVSPYKLQNCMSLFFFFSISRLSSNE